MNAEHSGRLVHSEFTRRGFIGVSAGAALAAALPAGALTVATVGVARLATERQAVYEALVEAVSLVPFTDVPAGEAGRASALLAQIYEQGEAGRRGTIDATLDAVPGSAGASAFVALSPRRRVAFLRRRLAAEPRNGLLRDALELTAMPFGSRRAQPPIGVVLAYSGAH